MKFDNTSGMHLDFELHGKRYKLAPHETVEIPDRVAHAVRLHGLPLVEAAPDAPVTASAETAPSAAERAEKALDKARAELEKEFAKEEEQLAEGHVPAGDADEPEVSVDGDGDAEDLSDADALVDPEDVPLTKGDATEIDAEDAPVTASAETAPSAVTSTPKQQHRRRR